MSVRSAIRYVASLFFVICVLVLCPAYAVQRVVYMNGINTTPSELDASKTRIEGILENSTDHIPDRREFSVETIWNKMGWYGTESFPLNTTEFFQDSRELFIQKTYEEWWYDAYASMLEYIKGGMDPYYGDLDRVTAGFYDPTPGMNSVECIDSPPEDDSCINDARMTAVRSAVADIMLAVSPNDPAVIVAHSQANLIVNEAYAMLVRQYGRQYANHAMQVVNLANTSAFSINGLDITHAGDEVLFNDHNSLTKLPSSMVPAWKRFTPRKNGEESGCGDIPSSSWQACDFKLRGATFNAPPSDDQNPEAAAIGIVAPCVVDPHSIDSTYLSNCKVTRAESASVSGASDLPGVTTFARYFEHYVYHAAEHLGVQGPIYPAAVVYGDRSRMYAGAWLGYATKTSASDGSWMRVAVSPSVSSAYQNVASQNFPTVQGVIRIRVKHRMHAGYDNYGDRLNFFPSIVLKQGDSTSVNVAFTRSTAAADYCYNSAFFDKVRITAGIVATDCSLSSTVSASSLYDSIVPIETVFLFNTRTGEFRLTTTNGSSLYPETYQHTGTVPASNRLPVTGIRLNTFGWYSGHWHEFYGLSVEQVMP